MIEAISITIQDFLALGVIATLLSVFFEWLKKSQEKKGQAITSDEAKVWIVGLSIAIGTGYFFVRDTNWFANVIQILTISSTVFALLLKKSRNKKRKPPIIRGFS